MNLIEQTHSETVCTNSKRIRNSRDVNFISNFNILDDISEVALLTELDQNHIESDIVNIIYQSFVIPADEDYLAARLLAQNGLSRAFYWSASQAIEKYLKALLLMNGQCLSSNRGHSVSAQFDKVTGIYDELKNIKFTLDTNINIDNGVGERVSDITLSSFLDDIDKFGSPDNRYNASGVQFNTWFLFALDTFIYEVRKYLSGPDILSNYKYINEELMCAFKDNNPKFNGVDYKNTKIPSEKFQVCSSVKTTKLDFISKQDTVKSKFVLDWLGMKGYKFPSKISQSRKKKAFK